MSPLTNCIKNKDTRTNPIWLMRQAGRYLPEFRDIRKKNTDFIRLCLNSDLATEITLQPIKRFGFDAAIIFSDILMIPYGLGQKVEFKKNFGPKLEDFEIDKLPEIDEEKFTKNLSPIYQLLADLKISEDEAKYIKNKKSAQYQIIQNAICSICIHIVTLPGVVCLKCYHVIC